MNYYDATTKAAVLRSTDPQERLELQREVEELERRVHALAVPPVPDEEVVRGRRAEGPRQEGRCEVTRIAVEIARTLPALADASEEDLRDLIDGWAGPGVPPLSRGESIVARWARVTEELLAGCDRETVDRALEVVDRLRAGMVR